MMRWLRDLGFRARALLFRSRMERELKEELADHLRREAERNEAAGMSPDEARRAAAIRFGGEERFREQARESWGVTALTDLGGDVRFARRQLFKNPAFSLLAVLTLALGIGGTVALSSVVYGLLLRPLPMPDAERVVTWWSEYNWRGSEFDHVRDVAQAYEGLAAFSNSGWLSSAHFPHGLSAASLATVVCVLSTSNVSFQSVFGILSRSTHSVTRAATTNAPSTPHMNG